MIVGCLDDRSAGITTGRRQSRRVGAADAKGESAVRLGVAAGVVDTQDPAVQGAQVRDLEERVALLEGRALADGALRRQAGASLAQQLSAAAAGRLHRVCVGCEFTRQNIHLRAKHSSSRGITRARVISVPLGFPPRCFTGETIPPYEFAEEMVFVVTRARNSL